MATDFLNNRLQRRPLSASSCQYPNSSWDTRRPQDVLDDDSNPNMAA